MHLFHSVSLGTMRRWAAGLHSPAICQKCFARIPHSHPISSHQLFTLTLHTTDLTRAHEICTNSLHDVYFLYQYMKSLHCQVNAIFF